MQLPEKASIEQVPALAATLPDALLAEGNGVFEIDASALAHFDTSTLALLMQAHRLAHVAGRGFAVTGAPAKLHQLAALYGIEALLSMSGPASPSLRPTAA